MARIHESNGLNDERSVEEVAGEERKRWMKGHVMVMPWPAQGHINPMMHLSNHLAAHGVLVTFINSQFNHDRILQSRAGRTHTDYIDKGNIRLVGIPDGLGYDEYVANFNVPKQAQALIDSEPMLVKLLEEVRPPITCIIADVFVIATPAVARQFGIPHVAFWTQTAASYAAHLFLTQNHASLKEYLKKICSNGNVDERVISCIPRCPTMSYNEVPTFLKACDPSDFLFSYLMTNFQMAPHNTLMLMNTFEQLEKESLEFIHIPNMLCVGPILPSQFVLDETASNLEPQRNAIMNISSFWVEDEEGCLPWLHRQKPSSVLYVSFGSITLMSIQQVSEFARALDASGCPFLMVVRLEMIVGGASVTFSDGFVDKMRDSGQGVFVAWAPQLEVLAHPAIGGFLTHAGWNSTIESICRGVPMLCWPYFADQMLNARCIVDIWKIGLEFIVEERPNNIEQASSNGGEINYNEVVVLVKSEEIEKKIRQLMDPLTSIEIRKQINSLSLGAKAAYGSSFHSNLKLLLDVISH